MRVIEFTVPAVPVAQPRPRAVQGEKHARIHTVGAGHPVHEFKAAVKMAARQAYSGPPLTGPLKATLLFVLPRLGNTPTKVDRKPKAKKPDIDNLSKTVLDALNKLLYRDDGQVAELGARKVEASADEQPFVAVRFEEFANCADILG